MGGESYRAHLHKFVFPFLSSIDLRLRPVGGTADTRFLLRYSCPYPMSPYLAEGD